MNTQFASGYSRRFTPVHHFPIDACFSEMFACGEGCCQSVTRKNIGYACGGVRVSISYSAVSDLGSRADRGGRCGGCAIGCTHRV